jgi:hypothetical protein
MDTRGVLTQEEWLLMGLAYAMKSLFEYINYNSNEPLHHLQYDLQHLVFKSL